MTWVNMKGGKGDGIKNLPLQDRHNKLKDSGIKLSQQLPEENNDRCEQKQALLR